MTMKKGKCRFELTEDEARHGFFSLAREIGTPVSQSASGERILSVHDQRFR